MMASMLSKYGAQVANRGYVMDIIRLIVREGEQVRLTYHAVDNGIISRLEMKESRVGRYIRCKFVPGNYLRGFLHLQRQISSSRD